MSSHQRLEAGGCFMLGEVDPAPVLFNNTTHDTGMIGHAAVASNANC